MPAISVSLEKRTQLPQINVFIALTNQFPGNVISSGNNDNVFPMLMKLANQVIEIAVALAVAVTYYASVRDRRNNRQQPGT